MSPGRKPTKEQQARLDVTWASRKKEFDLMTEDADQKPEETDDVNLGAPRGEVGSEGEGEALGEYTPYPDQAGVPEEMEHREGTTYEGEPEH